MVIAKTFPVEVVTEKSIVVEVKCFNCGKKLFECDKKRENSAKNAGICVSIKCNRCKQINHFNIK